MFHRLSPFQDRVYALLRIVTGLLFMFHGLQKIFGVLAERPQPEVGTLHWFAGILELVLGFLIAIGLFTRLAAFLASGEMAVAYIQAHWKFQFNDQFFPAINGGELALVYAFLFLYMACKGDGPWSVGGRVRPLPSSV
jgi:putative oxidoreductase